jgi:hypothetical protein
VNRELVQVGESMENVTIKVLVQVGESIENVTGAGRSIKSWCR